MESLEEWLTKLIRTCEIPSPSFDDISQVENTLKNVVDIFNNDAVDEDVEDLIYAALFNREVGIFPFIQTASQHKKVLDKPICEGFGLLVYLIEVNRRNKIKKYCLQIEEFCWKFWMEKESACLKENALKVLISLYTCGDVETNESVFGIRINKLTSEISQGKQTQMKVLQHQFHLLGVLCKKYPKKMHSRSENIWRLFVYRLEQEVQEEALTKLKGRFEGLTAFLHVSPLNNQDAAKQKLLSEAIKGLICLRGSKNREAHRAAMTLFSLHGSQFSREILMDYESWNKSLWYWINCDNTDDSRAGKLALNKFYQVISEELLKIEADQGREIYQDLIEEVERQERRNGLGVAGFGYLSATAKIIFGPDEVSKLFTSVKRQITSKFFRDENSFQLSVRLLPIYMETLSVVTGNLDHVTMDQVVALQEITVHLIENYPNFPEMQKYQCAETVIIVVNHLTTKGSLVNVFLEKVLYQGLIRSCSFPLPMDIELLKEELKDTGHNAPTVTGSSHYVPFWQGLFGPTRSQMIVKKGMDVLNKRTQELLFDQFISSILVILGRLDLSLIKEDDTGVVNAAEKILRPKNEYGLASSKPKDFVIFCNLVSIISEVLPTIDLHLMEKCLIQITMGIIDHSEKLPLISGFYKLLESCLLICIKLRYFEDTQDQADSMDLSSATASDHEKENLFSKLKQFLQNMLMQIKHYKGDLKLSCLRVLMATPTPIIRIILPQLVSPMKSVFEIGCSYYKLADAGIGALEKWSVELPLSEWGPILKQILPSLDSFLKIGVHSKSESSVSLSVEKLRKASNSRRKYLVAKRRLESKGNVKDLTTHYQLQRKCLLFLGQLSPSMVQAFTADENESELGMAWDTEDHLPFPIPLPDIHPCIYIDKFLPRIVDLSLTSSDRNTRIAACEVLHAFIMYLLGKGVQLSSNNPDQLSKLVQRLVPSLIQLGCYPDDTVKSLFQKLLFSLSHWYSRNWKSKDSEIWIDALLDGLCDPNNAAIRDLSASCLKEFIERKLPFGEGGSKVPLSCIERILEKICSFSLHSNQHRRIGAAMALNSLYPVLDGDASVMNLFGFELLYCQLMAMEMCDLEGSPSNWLMSCSLGHLEETLKSQANIFNKDSKKRRRPPGFEGVLLKDLLLWLLSKIGSIGPSCRKACMRLFLSLAPCAQGYSGPEYFIGEMIEEHGVEMIIDICEGMSDLKSKPLLLSSVDTLDGKYSRKDLLSLLDWLNSLTTSLQCYVWLFENRLVKPSQIFLEGGNQKIFSAVCDFLSSLEKFNDRIMEALSELSLPSNSAILESDGEKCCGPSVCGVCVQIFKFACCFYHDSQSNAYVQSIHGSLFTPSLWKLVASFIFNHSIRASYKGNPENLQRALKSLLEVITSLPASLKEAFFTIMDVEFQKVPKSELEEIQAVLIGDKLYVYMDFVDSLLFLQESSQIKENFKWPYINELEEGNLLQLVFDALFTDGSPEVVCAPLSQAKIKYLESLLKLSLCQNKKAENLISLITDSQKVGTMFSKSNMTKGEHFFMCFKSCLMSYFFLDLKSSMDSLLKHLSLNEGGSAPDTIMGIIKDVFADQRMKESHMDYSFISPCLSSHWQNLLKLSWMDEWSSRIFDVLLAIYVGVPGSIEILREEKGIHYWIVKVLTSSRPLEKKVKALELLPCLVSHVDEENNQLGSYLQQLFIQYFPLEEETDQSSRKNKNADREMVFQRLLMALELTSSPMLLKFIMNNSRGGSISLNHDCLEKSLTAAVKRADAGLQLNLITAAYSVAKEEGMEGSRLGAVRNFISKLIKTSGKIAVENFYKDSINEIHETLKGSLMKSCTGLRGQLITKIVCFQLVEIMLLRLNKQLEEPDCPIFLMIKSEKKCGREMIQCLMRMCYYARSHTDKHEGLEDLFRRYRCAAYNAAVSIVANLRKETKYFKNVFEVDVGNKLWEGLVDTSVAVCLPRCFDKLPEVVTVDAPICEGEESRKKKMRWDSSLQSSVCLTTQEFLADCTLNEDITKFDYQNCSVRSLCQTMRELTDDNINSLEAGEISTPTQITHEKDPANDHECMPTVTSLIKHLVAEGIFPSDNNSEDFDWLNSIKEGIEYSDRHNNVKIFLVRVILNCEEELIAYSEVLMAPIMKLVADGCLGHDINYLVTDVIQMLLAWYNKNPTILISKTHVSGMFNFFALKAEDSREHIFKGYMDLIRSMYEPWKNFIDIPYEALLAKLMVKSSWNLGLILSRLFLEHSKIPWRPADKQRFLDGLLGTFQKEERKHIYLSAHVIGQVLRAIDPEEIGKDNWISLEENDKNFTLSVIKILYKIKDYQKDLFLKCLMEIQQNYSGIVDEFNSCILCQLPNLRGKLLTIGMALICSRVEKLEWPFLFLKDKGLQRWLTTNIPEDQQIALKMVMKVLPKLKEEEILEILDSLLSFHCHSSAECRKIMFEILIWIFDNFCLNDWDKTPEEISSEEMEDENQSWTNKCTKTLLYGLIDEEKSIQSRVCSFFENKPGLKLSDPTPDRFINIMAKLYSPATEASFLGYALTLLLSPSASTPSYNELLFEHPLAECVFEDYQPRTSHRTLDLDMSPMFTDSLASSLTQMDLDPQTQSQNSSAITSKVIASQRSLAFSSGDVPLFTLGTGFSGDTVDGGSTTLFGSMIPGDGVFKRPNEIKRRRYLSRPKDRAYYAAIENRKSTQRMESVEERARKRDAEITLHRKFRVGDFPDVQIHCYDILQPLCAVAKRDPVIAQQFFVSLVDGILEKMKTSCGDFNILALQGREAFKRILNLTKQYSGPLMSAVLEISLGHVKYFSLNVDSVMKVVSPSGLSPLACLFLEARLNQWQPEQHARFYDRSRAGNDKAVWLQLAMMYQGMEEYDVVHGIFHDLMGCGGDVKEALECERSGQWTKGKTAFRKILSVWALGDGDDDTDFIERDYYYEGYFKCLGSLSQWSDLSKVVMNQLENSFDEAWNDGAFWIPWLIKSQVNSGLELESNAEEFFNYIRNHLKDNDKRIYLQSNHSRELALIHSMFGQYEQSRNLVRKYYDSFLEEWPHLSPLSSKIKNPKLLSTQLTSELSLFLSVMKSHETQQLGEDYKRLCKIWEVNLPNQMEPLSHWEHRIACRHLFIRKMIAADVGNEIPGDENNIDLGKTSALMALSLVDMAISTQNFHTAEKYLKKSEAVLKKHSDAALRLPWHISQATLPWVKGLNSKCVSDAQLKLFVEAWNSLVGICRDSQLALIPDLHLRVIQKVFTVSKSIHKIFRINPAATDNFDSSIKMNIMRLIKDSTSSSSSLTDRISEYGVKQLEESVNVAQAISENCMADQYLELAKYCQYLMDDMTENYEELSMKSILRAMAYGSQQARQWFPCILQFTSFYSSLSDLFRTESSRVPTWMFLSWISQILAHLNGSSCSTLSDLIVRLAETYPAAIVFPFQVSFDKFQRENSEAMRGLTNRLKNALFKNKLLEKLIESLKYVCLPHVMVMSHLDKITDLLESSNPIMEEVERAKSLMLDELFPQSRGRRVVGAQCYGDLFHVVREHEKEIRNIISSLSSTTIKSRASGPLKQIHGLIRTMETKRSPSHLKHYSPWLLEFRSLGQGECVELPGQYTGDCEPRVEEHVKIVGFLPEVAVMKSLRKPICITVIGSDAKEHKFLIKNGEDLRLDQRIEQLFGLMNKMLAVNAATKERKLYINTYGVIPLTRSLGVIEWVDNTLPLYNLLSLSMKDEEKKKRQSVFMEHKSWMEKAGSNRLIDVYLKYGRSETVRHFAQKAEAFPCDMLRRSLLKLSLSLESFWSLRNAFATSHATLCIAHWLLGVGDRHNNNTLVSMTSGRVIGIDFGYSFGTATQLLPVPEIMPFRLTPQIMGLTQPFGEVGLMKEAMIHTLRAFQENYDILLATMDVFVKEPSVDWLKQARKQAKQDGVPASELDEYCSAYPKQKIMLIKRKFVGGTNPGEITSEELSSRKFDQAAIRRKLMEVAAGDSHNVRANLPKQGLSCEQQVSCLIDQATDYHVLGKTYYGWEPWL